MKNKFSIVVCALLVLLLASNIYLLMRVNRLEKMLTPGGSPSQEDVVNEGLVGTWVCSKDTHLRVELTISEDGTVEKVTWCDEFVDYEWISQYYVGHLDGNVLLFSGQFSSHMAPDYTSTNALPLQDYSEFSTLTLIGNNALKEVGTNNVVTQYTRQS